MKNIKRFLLLAICTFTISLFINCTLSQTDNFSRIINKEWKVVSISGKELIAAELENGLPTITFNENNKLSGSTSCNTFYGSYKLED
jgi:heat shock protein HslJ